MIFTGVMLIALAVTVLGYALLDLLINGPPYWCKWRHKQYHSFKPIEFGGAGYMHCSKCNKYFSRPHPAY
jgi:hypothetical protein